MQTIQNKRQLVSIDIDI